MNNLSLPLSNESNLFLTLFEAVSQKDIEAVRRLLPLDPAVNINQLHENNSLLHIAVENFDKDMIDLLLNQPGIDVNIGDDIRKTPLHQASLNFGKDTVSIVKALIKAGANVNIEDTRGYTPLLLKAKAVHRSRGLDSLFQNQTAGGVPVERITQGVVTVLLTHGSDMRNKEVESFLLEEFILTSDAAFRALLVIAGLPIQNKHLHKIKNKEARVKAKNCITNIENKLKELLDPALNNKVMSDLLHLPTILKVIRSASKPEENQLKTVLWLIDCLQKEKHIPEELMNPIRKEVIEFNLKSQLLTKHLKIGFKIASKLHFGLQNKNSDIGRFYYEERFTNQFLEELMSTPPISSKGVFDHVTVGIEKLSRLKFSRH